ncbi:MAG: YicC family protein [Spirochaetales bacterium]|nr:YicC family protein [Spirochaetales bacterium]
MKSMTGYGFSEIFDQQYICSVEIKSYNNKFLDINLNLPHFLSGLEMEVRKSISERVKRGRVDVFVKFKNLNENIVLNLDKNALVSYSKILKKMRKLAKVKTPVNLEHLLQFDDIIKSDKKTDLDLVKSRFFPILDGAIDEFEKSREVEGLTIKSDIQQKIALIQNHVDLIESKAVELDAKIKNDLKTRFDELEIDSIDNSRIYEETAVFLVKYSINEEISRMKAHLASFSRTLEENNPIGKKLDFICQEFNREINTIGSKSILIELNQSVIEVKDCIEMIREQLRNAE